MRACIQRVKRARVLLPEKNNECTGEIGQGFLILLGVGAKDEKKEAELLARKIGGLRIFEDEMGHMNRELSEVGGSILVVSQFTLYGDCSHGKRPSFFEAARPEPAKVLYEIFVEQIRHNGIPVETGVFQEMMDVELVNDGPVTLWLDTDLFNK